MLKTVEPMPPRTTTDVVFDQLHSEILSLELLPGTRISEAEVANRLSVSRQPVRDAFNRLANLGLLKIRPQRATVISGFSWKRLENTRFIRLAIELEVAKQACANWDEPSAEMLEANLTQQRTAVENRQVNQFHSLDYGFHQLICSLSGHPLAFNTIKECKQQVDRLCVLSLARSDEISAVLDDHQSIASALAKGSQGEVEAIFRRHLSRLDSAIEDIHKKHANYFE